MSEEKLVTCRINNCGKTFPEELTEKHYDEAHASEVRQQALKKITSTKAKEEKIEEKITSKENKTAPSGRSR